MINENRSTSFPSQPQAAFGIAERTLPPKSTSRNCYLPLHVSSRFGVRLRELRQEHRMTQLTLAERFGIDRTYVSDVERGRKSISLPFLEVLALGFELSLSDLLRGI